MYCTAGEGGCWITTTEMFVEDYGDQESGNDETAVVVARALAVRTFRTSRLAATRNRQL